MGKKIFYKISPGVNYLLDSNFVINYFKGLYKGAAGTYADSLINETTFISVITRIELLGWQSILPEDELIINNFITDSVVFYLEESIIQQTIALRKMRNEKDQITRCHYCSNRPCTQFAITYPQCKRF